MFRFGKNAKREVIIDTQVLEVPVVLARPARHSPELERSRIDNLLEVSRLVHKEAPEIGRLALDQALEIGEAQHLPMDEILAGIPSQY